MNLGVSDSLFWRLAGASRIRISGWGLNGDVQWRRPVEGGKREIKYYFGELNVEVEQDRLT